MLYRLIPNRAIYNFFGAIVFAAIAAVSCAMFTSSLFANGFQWYQILMCIVGIYFLYNALRLFIKPLGKTNQELYDSTE